MRKISKTVAAILVYIMCAYGYLTTKGFVFDGHNFILSNNAEASENVQFSVSSERVRALGDDNAPLTMYIFSAMTCSHCQDFHKFILPKLERDFISKGLLRFMYIHFPSDETTMRAAKLSYCVPKDKFYDFITDLYDNRDWRFTPDETKLENHAKKFGLTDGAITNCKEDKKLTSDILLMRNSAYTEFNITVTPTIVIESANGRKVMNAKTYDELKQYIESLIKGE